MLFNVKIGKKHKFQWYYSMNSQWNRKKQKLLTISSEHLTRHCQYCFPKFIDKDKNLADEVSHTSFCEWQQQIKGHYLNGSMQNNLRYYIRTKWCSFISCLTFVTNWKIKEAWQSIATWAEKNGITKSFVELGTSWSYYDNGFDTAQWLNRV